MRVSSGSIQPSSGASTATAAPGAPASSAASQQRTDSSRITTTSDNDFWTDIANAIKTIIGADAGSNVVVNAQAGVILVRALPANLRTVEQYLKAMSLVVERQVMLEAKIIEVTLNDQYSAGVNWAAFKGNFATGTVQPGAVLGNYSTQLLPPPSPQTVLGQSVPLSSFTARASDGTPLQNSNVSALPGTVGGLLAGSNVPGSVFGLAFQASTFAALLSFLESQGTVHVLSSPRIATLNNQKAVIKVGTDEFFVTNISTTTTTSGTGNTISPTITVQPFFSGIALDVTPQISDDDQITLHIHPSVSLVTDKTKTLNLGTLGTITLPLASSNINESDTIVRVQDGAIAAIGGLMKQGQSSNDSGLPGTRNSAVLSNIFGSRSQLLSKSELVILLKTTIIKGDAAWQQQAQELNERMQGMRRDPPPGAAR